MFLDGGDDAASSEPVVTDPAATDPPGTEPLASEPPPSSESPVETEPPVDGDSPVIEPPATEPARRREPADAAAALPAAYVDYESEVYADDAVWMCRGGAANDDICERDLDATAVFADGHDRTPTARAGDLIRSPTASTCTPQCRRTRRPTAI